MLLYLCDQQTPLALQLCVMVEVILSLICCISLSVAPQWTDTWVILNNSQFATDSFRQQQRVKCLDLYINCSVLCLQSQCLHPSSCLLYSFISRLEIFLLQPSSIYCCLKQVSANHVKPVSIIPVSGTPFISTMTV